MNSSGIFRLLGQRLLGRINLQRQMVFNRKLSTVFEFKQLDKPFPLTEKEAHLFLEDTLGMEDVYQKIEGDKKAFLNEMMGRMYKTIPFQTLIFIAQAKDDMKITFENIKETMFNKQGGVCLQINPFAKAVLDNMGFDCYYYNALIGGSIGTHLGIAVRNLSFNGSIHVLDPGTQFPLLEIIPMDFEKESPVYKHSYLRHKYRMRDDGRVEWLHEANPTTISRKVTEEELKRGWFIHGVLDCFEPSDFITGLKKVDKLWQSVEGGLVYTPRIRAMVNGKFLMLQTDRVITGDGETGDLTYTPVNSRDEMEELYVKYFPQFSKEYIGKVLRRGSRPLTHAVYT